jgi:prevent-host-death family protein
MQVNVHEAKTQLSRLLELVEEGETIIIARHGRPVAELVPARQTGFPFGIAQAEPLVAPGDDWWQPMSDEESEDWIAGR